MKITSFAIIFVLIFSPFFQIASMRLDDLDKVMRLTDRYNLVTKTAIQDAAYMLNETVDQKYEPGYGSKKFFRANKERAVEAFYRTLALNFNVDGDAVAIGALAGYIPAVAVIDYDGYYIYATEQFVDSGGQAQMRLVWSPKKPYSYADTQGNIVNFSLDGFVKTYDRSSLRWVQGQRAEVVASTQIPLLRDGAAFETIRRQTIINAIQNDLAYVINRHNQYATRYGIDYLFTLPQISQEEWDNGIDDIGIVAFIQGIPVGDQQYNNYSFGGGMLKKKKVIYGSVDPSTGIRYYSRDPARLPAKVEERFENEKDAARSGYFPVRN
ncbi:hypothetical protein [Saccharibacillus endophyticus]|uniref:F0F1-type ATP synthase n=1 Tax=Saccharibacillus endophyticus TaxID=2060666 RepID=A0ABQ1ZMR8_9BACL|nr:hypothetical protein [Saccharibacillus endophyticus]GGH70726.1 hypothetical protein GCM10007362_07100 [Saccharibacillus endophyticus]